MAGRNEGARLDDYHLYCDASGFKCWASETVVQWDGARVLARFADKRNPQDFVRAVPDDQRVPNPRPEPADVYLGENILTVAGVYIFTQSGAALLTSGG